MEGSRGICFFVHLSPLQMRIGSAIDKLQQFSFVSNSILTLWQQRFNYENFIFVT